MTAMFKMFCRWKQRLLPLRGMGNQRTILWTSMPPFMMRFSRKWSVLKCPKHSLQRLLPQKARSVPLPGVRVLICHACGTVYERHVCIQCGLAWPGGCNLQYCVENSVEQQCWDVSGGPPAAAPRPRVLREALRWLIVVEKWTVMGTAY